jgi:hypothetical protein
MRKGQEKIQSTNRYQKYTQLEIQHPNNKNTQTAGKKKNTKDKSGSKKPNFHRR